MAMAKNRSGNGKPYKHVDQHQSVFELNKIGGNNANNKQILLATSQFLLCRLPVTVRWIIGYTAMNKRKMGQCLHSLSFATWFYLLALDDFDLFHKEQQCSSQIAFSAQKSYMENRAATGSGIVYRTSNSRLQSRVMRPFLNKYFANVSVMPWNCLGALILKS